MSAPVSRCSQYPPDNSFSCLWIWLRPPESRQLLIRNGMIPPDGWTYSDLSAIIGSTAAARRDGSQQATDAVKKITRVIAI